MEEKTDIEILTEFAKGTNRFIEANEVPYPSSFIRKNLLRFKRTVYIPNDPERNSFYICYNDPYHNIEQSAIFSGAFIPLALKTKTKVSIRKRDVVDKVNIFSRNKPMGVGSYKFDSKVVINGDLDLELRGFLSKTKLQNKILEVLGMNKGFIKISINEFNLDFVPEFKNSSYLSIINNQEWEVDKDRIEQFFNQIEMIRKVITF